MNAVTENNRLALTVDVALQQFVDDELLPGLGIDPKDFWEGFADIVEAFTADNRALLDERESIQGQIDAWHRDTRGRPWDADAYRGFLKALGYIEPEGEPFQIDTQNVDPELASTAGPQLVVPVDNARFALNAANARWGSLYDALYGTNAIDEAEGHERGTDYNPKRGARVVETAARFLDEAVPLASGQHADVCRYRVVEDAPARLICGFRDGTETCLEDPAAFIAYRQEAERLTILLRRNGMHIELKIDPAHPIGSVSPSGLADVILESALTTIADCEDSVAAVDAEDKVRVYRNWLGLMRGTLEATFEKSGDTLERRLAEDRLYTSVDGQPLTLPGRSVLLVRNVGHLMTTPAVLDADGQEVFEGLLDAVITTTCALYDLRDSGLNSRTGSVYIVKPKMHGSKEVAFANRLFNAVEDLLELPRHTIKIGVMDEERRTSINLDNCLREVKHRVVFINTGFLDRTGDEIHTSMEAGAVLGKSAIKSAGWLAAYERRNVAIGLERGLPGHGQIGKGMWPMPDAMREMLDTKQVHLKAGATCAWVPSPTAATLHAMHYHQIDVFDVQARLKGVPAEPIDALLEPPLLAAEVPEISDIYREIDNNAQGILGYVVRWIDHGVGCSKVPDIDDVALMEDRATCRISSQHLANWLHHGLCSERQVVDAFKRMAAVVDRQNAHDPAYTPMAPGFDGPAFKAALALALEGRDQPSGYTEPLLHRYRRLAKEAVAQ